MPARTATAWQPSNLQIALLVSLAIHALLLTIRLVDPEGFERVFKETPLEVVLVNTQSKERPDKAQAIAQANLMGGGDANAGRASTPLPPSALTRVGNDSDDQEAAEKKLQALREQQTELLAQIRQEIAQLSKPDPRIKSEAERQAREERRRQLIQLLGEIERRINEENSKPRKRYVSPSTREEVYALYYDSLRRRIEDRGTANFPEVGGKKLYGDLTMILTVDHRGHLLATEVVQSSGNALLDKRAEAIARSAGPYPPFSAPMRRKADQLVLVARFRFTRDESLEASVHSR